MGKSSDSFKVTMIVISFYSLVKKSLNKGSNLLFCHRKLLVIGRSCLLFATLRRPCLLKETHTVFFSISFCKLKSLCLSDTFFRMKFMIPCFLARWRSHSIYLSKQSIFLMKDQTRLQSSSRNSRHSRIACFGHVSKFLSRSLPFQSLVP